MQYLKIWEGVTSGTHLGRDDGYPETKLLLIDSLDQLVRTIDTNAEYFKLSRVNVDGIVEAVKDLSIEIT